MGTKVLLTRRIPSTPFSTLQAAHDVDLNDGPSPMPSEAIRARLAGTQALICQLTETISAEVIAGGPELRVIANVAAGYDNIDVAAAKARGIVVTNTPGVLTQATAEFTWGLILAAARRVAEGDRLVRRGGWSGWALDFMLGTELRGKQLGIIGAGRIGRAVAAIAPAFGMTAVFAHKQGQPPKKQGQPPFYENGKTVAVPVSGSGAVPVSETVAVPVSLDELLVTSDVVSIHVPGGAATRHMIDRKALARMKRSAILVNTSRGTVVDEEALAWALKERLIAAAALDVYEREPTVYEPLLAFENVVLAPHLGSATRETRTAMAQLAVDNVLAVLAGKPAVTPV